MGLLAPTASNSGTGPSQWAFVCSVCGPVPDDVSLHWGKLGHCCMLKQWRRTNVGVEPALDRRSSNTISLLPLRNFHCLPPNLDKCCNVAERLSEIAAVFSTYNAQGLCAAVTPKAMHRLEAEAL